MDLTKGDMLIFSGEGDNGTWERYEGKRTPAAIRNRLSRERVGGDRWAHAWIGEGGRYAKLGTDLESTGDERKVDDDDIRVNPAAQLAAGHKRPGSAANGAKGGRPTGHHEWVAWLDDDWIFHDGQVLELSYTGTISLALSSLGITSNEWLTATSKQAAVHKIKARARELFED